jgi:hypothetical protein
VTSTIRLAIKSANVVHEIIEGETIIFNLETGVYYSLTGAGTEIWMLLEIGGTVTEITLELARYYHRCREDLEQPVAQLVAELTAENLIAPCPAAPDDGVPTLAEADGPERPFAPPLLKKYDDMQDLLLIDPVHDVEEQQGWPVPKVKVVP